MIEKAFEFVHFFFKIPKYAGYIIITYKTIVKNTIKLERSCFFFYNSNQFNPDIGNFSLE